MKWKVLIIAYTCKAAYNVGGTTIHSAMLMPFNNSHFLPLSKELLDTLSKLYDGLQIVFIDEASLIVSHLENIDLNFNCCKSQCQNSCSRYNKSQCIVSIKKLFIKWDGPNEL